VAIEACPSSTCTARRLRVPRWARLAKRKRSQPGFT
jgi:hypothetical protein